jgi:hypothetical protein
MDEAQAVPIRGKNLENAPVVYVHGAWGGVGPRGEIVAYLYQDTIEFPEQFSLVISDNGAIVKTETPEYEPKLTRTVRVTLLLTPNVALSFANWLREKAELAVKTLESAQSPKKGDEVTETASETTRVQRRGRKRR